MKVRCHFHTSAALPSKRGVSVTRQIELSEGPQILPRLSIAGKNVFTC